jgi:ATP-dependent helicase/nuclease subunit A
MTKPASPPDQAERTRALDPAHSILVQAPAGSGKTDLLTRRFLRLLATVDDPKQIVAITFTVAAAAEMRHRIMSELERAASGPPPLDQDPHAMPVLAWHALERSRQLGWQLTDLPAQLRISTIDSFCREIAIQQPLLSGFGSDLAIEENPSELYRRAARRTLEQIDSADTDLADAVEKLLLWRDNGWHDMESLLVEMLKSRDRWMHNFVLSRELDWDALRTILEQPLLQASTEAFNNLQKLLDHVPHARREALELARFACAETAGRLYQELAEMPEFPAGPFANSDALEEARRAFVCLYGLLLTKDGEFRQQINKNVGFSTERRTEKARLTQLIEDLRAVEGFESALAGIVELPPPRYTADEALVLRACFVLLRRAAGELQAVFAEVGTVDFVEVAQIAMRILAAEDNSPSDAAIKISDDIHHLLVDEFQDTSRRQHALIARLVAAWPDLHNRTLFVVGDPMQSIYFFRGADAELFPRVRQFGLEIPDNTPLLLDPVTLTANFRTEPSLVAHTNHAFAHICSSDDGSGIAFSPSQPARPSIPSAAPRLQLYLDFVPQTSRAASANRNPNTPDPQAEREAAKTRQTAQIVDLIRRHLDHARFAAAQCAKHRIAILARTRKTLATIANALREAAIPFRAIDLEELKDRPEVLDVLALARALLNPMDRVAWLGILRAPWCGLSLADLHALTSDDNPTLLARPIPELLSERLSLAGVEARPAIERVLRSFSYASAFRAANPSTSLGTWIQQVWLHLGGASCVNTTERANLNLLFGRLDTLADGPLDLLSSALDASLEMLKALPDPDADSDNGVQLMTIHKAKGLEFEVVIVPEMQAHAALTRGNLLSWLERGIAEPDDSGAITEFLVAPIQPKGEERGTAKRWVDRIRTEREKQEMRRTFYVAATRAREELYLFARPEFKSSAAGRDLIEPKDSLLAAAWPALQQETLSRFNEWISLPHVPEGESDTALPLAAGASLFSISGGPPTPTHLRRLPPDFAAAAFSASSSATNLSPIDATRAELFARHEGGLLSRALGNAVHASLEELARLRITLDWPAAFASLRQIAPRIAADIRSSGIRRSDADSIAAQAIDLARNAAADPTGAWILSPHPQAASEIAWTGILDGTLRTVRVDRIFCAGATPLSQGNNYWWIIDYKTAQAEDADNLFGISELRSLFAPQLETYATTLRHLHGADARIVAALYYPRILQLDWWEISS